MGCSCINAEKTRNSIKIASKRDIEEQSHPLMNQQSHSRSQENDVRQRNQRNDAEEQKNSTRNNINRDNPALANLNQNRVNSNQVNQVNSNIEMASNNNNHGNPGNNNNEYFNSCSSSDSESDNERDEFFRANEPFLQSKIDPSFNFPEANEMSGTGLKKMKGYICPISKEDLEKKRNDFWSSRIEGDHTIWSTLKACCECDDMNNIKAILDAAEIKPLKKCLNLTYDLQGVMYEIPNYCLNPPVSFDVKAKDFNKPEEKNLHLRIRYVDKELIIKVSNYSKILILIEAITNSLKKDDPSINNENVRLFYCGRELKRQDDLWNYKINEENIIQIFIRK